MPVTKVTCLNHEGTNPAILIQQWNGKSWEIITDWIPAMTDVVRPLIEQGCGAIRQGKQHHPARLLVAH